MKKILVVGAGIAGLSVARFLREYGFDVTVFEKASLLRTGGAGLMLGINAVKILDQLRLLDALVERSQVLDGFVMADAGGQEISRNNARYMKTQSGFQTLAVHRQVLHEVLSQGLLDQVIQFNRRIENLEQDSEGVWVTCNQGLSSRYDLVIAADGVYSSMRSLLNIPSHLRYAGYTCWRFVIARPENVKTNLGYEYWGQGKRFGIVPLGDDLLYGYATINATQNDAKWASISVTEFKSLFCDLQGQVPDVLSALVDADCMIHDDLYDQREICFQHGRVALVGDAAHAMTPNMGQGAAMALEDTAVIVQCLTSSNSVSHALQQYQQRRMGRVKKMRDQSYSLGKIAQWHSPLLMRARNALMRRMPEQSLDKRMCKMLLEF